MNKKLVNWVLLTFALVVTPSMALQTEELNVTTCTDCDNMANINVNDTNTGLTIPKAVTETIDAWSDLTGVNPALDNTVIFAMRHSGEAGINTAKVWDIVFQSEDGLTEYCTDNSVALSDSDTYVELNTSLGSCAWTVARLNDLEMTFLNNDDKGGQDGFIYYTDLFIDYNDVPSFDVNLVANETTVTIGAVINYSATGNDPDSDAYSLTVCKTDSITDNYPGVCVATSSYALLDEEGDGGEDGTNYAFIGDTAANAGYDSGIGFNNSAEIVITRIDLDIGSTGGSDYGAVVDVDICEWNRSYNGLTSCVDFNGAWNPSWSTGLQSILGVPFVASANVGYVVFFNTTSSDGDSSSDFLAIEDDTSASVNNMFTFTTDRQIYNNVTLQTTDLLCFVDNVTDATNAYCEYTTVSGDKGTLDGFGFLCDAGTNKCNPTSTSDSVTVNPVFGWLNATIQEPVEHENVTQNTVFSVNVTVTCEGAAGAECGQVEGYARYNSSGVTMTDINVSVGGTPFYLIGGGSDPTNMTQGDLNFSVSDNETSPHGLFNNDTHWFVTGLAADQVFIYNATGDYISNWTVGDSCLNPSGMDGNASHLFIVCTDDNVHLRTLAGADTGGFSTSSEISEATGIAFNGTHFFVGDRLNAPNISIYTVGGSFVVEINISVPIRLHDLDYDINNDWFIIYDSDCSPDCVRFITYDGESLLNFSYVNDQSSGNLNRDGIWLDDTDSSKVYIVVDDDPNHSVIEWDIEGVGSASNPDACSDSDLILDENCTLSWSVNATGTNHTTYLIDVLFNSTTYYSDGLLDNNTVDRTICIGSQCFAGVAELSISNVVNWSINNESAVINWTTNIASNTSVNYGTTTSLGTVIGNDVDVTIHNITLSDLNNETTYYYNVTSCDATPTCVTEGWYNFTTATVSVDSCTYGDSGVWLIDCTDNCLISTEVNVLGNNVNFSNAGLTNITGRIYNFTVAEAYTCTVHGNLG